MNRSNRVVSKKGLVYLPFAHLSCFQVMIGSLNLLLRCKGNFRPDGVTVQLVAEQPTKLGRIGCRKKFGTF